MLKNKVLLTSLLISFLFGCGDDSKDQASLSEQQLAAKQTIDKVMNFNGNSEKSVDEMVTNANQIAAKTMEGTNTITAQKTDVISRQQSDSVETMQKLQTGMTQRPEEVVNVGQDTMVKLDNIDDGSLNNQTDTSITPLEVAAAIRDVEKLIQENPTASGMKSPNLQQSTEELITAARSARAGDIIRNSISFQTNSNTLESTSIRILDAFAENLKNQHGLQVKIAGFTDTTGLAENNAALSLQRAKSVKQYLVSKGVNSGTISVKGYGELNPIADNSTVKGRSANRRVELGLH